MLSAIEIYNKPDFSYREEAFSILAVNAWELLLKAKLLKMSNYKMTSLYFMEPKKKKNGEDSKYLQPRKNRSGNASTIGIPSCIMRLKLAGVQISPNLFKSLHSLIELRDNAIHFHNTGDISKEIQELGFACVKNYMSLIEEWEMSIDLSQYNFYLMPLAYVDSQIEAKGVLTDQVKNYLNFLKKKVSEADDTDENYEVAIGIDISFRKASTLDGIGMRYGEDGVSIALSEEDITKKYPLTHQDVWDKAKIRYSDFKYNNHFHSIMKLVKEDTKLYHERKLDPNNPKSQTKPFYSGNVIKFLDKHYNKV